MWVLNQCRHTPHCCSNPHGVGLEHGNVRMGNRFSHLARIVKTAIVLVWCQFRRKGNIKRILYYYLYVIVAIAQGYGLHPTSQLQLFHSIVSNYGHNNFVTQGIPLTFSMLMLKRFTRYKAACLLPLCSEWEKERRTHSVLPN